MTNTTYDDNDSKALYNTAWAVLKTSASQNLTGWYDETFHSCNTGYITGAQMCTATIDFTGTHIALYGDANPAQGRFFCYLDGEPWNWFDGSEFLTGKYTKLSLDHLRCSVKGISNGSHRLVFGQDKISAGTNGITLDYFVIDDLTAAGDSAVWTSEFASTTPQTGYANTTAIPSTISSTSSPISTASSTESSSPSSTSTPSSGGGGISAATGAGIGVGVGAVGLAVLGLVIWLFCRRRRGISGAKSSGSLSTTHDLDNMTMRSAAPGGVVPYTSYSPVAQGGSPGLPEIQPAGEVQPYSSTAPYVSRSQAGSQFAGLEDPQTFSSRGGR